MLIGSRAYSNLERTLSEQAVEGNLLLLGLRVNRPSAAKATGTYSE